MAWTLSAAQRRSYAGTPARALIQHYIANNLSWLGKGDAARGACIVSAAFLTIAGAAVPHIAPATLTALLFLSGAALILFTVLSPFTGAITASDPVKLNPDTARTIQTRAAMTPKPALFSEFFVRPETATAIDRAAFERLTAHMSHELRTPLNAVLGFSELISNEVFGPLGASCYAGYARDIHTSGRMLLKSAEDALAITALLTAQAHRGGQPVTNLAACAADAVAFHTRDLVTSNLSIDVAVDPALDIIADTQALRQLLINVLADGSERAAPGASLMLAAVVSGSHIDVTLEISALRTASPSNDERFALLLARTLSELLGTRLIERSLSCGGHHLSVRFLPAAQRDFFALR
jgi:signal transduction histidine kinase